MVSERVDSQWSSSMAGFTSNWQEDPMYRLKNLEETESIKEYYEAFDSIQRCLELPEEFLLSWFIAGLREDTRIEVRPFRPRTVFQAYAYGRFYEIAYPKGPPLQPVPSQSSSSSTSLVSHRSPSTQKSWLQESSPSMMLNSGNADEADSIDNHKGVTDLESETECPDLVHEMDLQQHIASPQKNTEQLSDKTQKESAACKVFDEMSRLNHLGVGANLKLVATSNIEGDCGRQSLDRNILGKPPEKSDRGFEDRNLSTGVVQIVTKVAGKEFDKMLNEETGPDLNTRVNLAARPIDRMHEFGIWNKTTTTSSNTGMNYIPKPYFPVLWDNGSMNWDKSCIGCLIVDKIEENQKVGTDVLLRKNSLQKFDISGKEFSQSGCVRSWNSVFDPGIPDMSLSRLPSPVVVLFPKGDQTMIMNGCRSYYTYVISAGFYYPCFVKMTGDLIAVSKPGSSAKIFDPGGGNREKTGADFENLARSLLGVHSAYHNFEGIEFMPYDRGKFSLIKGKVTWYKFSLEHGLIFAKKHQKFLLLTGYFDGEILRENDIQFIAILLPYDRGKFRFIFDDEEEELTVRIKGILQLSNLLVVLFAAELTMHFGRVGAEFRLQWDPRGSL